MMYKKFQQGGNALPAFLSYSPVVSSNTPEDEYDEVEEKESKSADLTDKDLLKMIKEKMDGLPNDIDMLTQSLQNFYLDQQYMLNPPTTNIASRYVAILGQLQKAKFSREAYDKAYNHLESNEGMSEVAIDENGYLFCVNRDGTDFKKMTLDQVNKQSEYTPLTNSQLLQFRAWRPDLVGRDEILSVAAQGVGMPSIQNLINSMINSLGTTELEREGVSQTKQGQIAKGIEYLNEAAQLLSDKNIPESLTLDGIYKSGALTKDQTAQVQLAINYIISALPKNMKTLLEYKAETAGLNKNGKGVENLISQLILSKASNTNKFSITSFSDEDKSSSDNIEDKLQLSPVMMMLHGLTAETNINIINGTTAGINITAQQLPIVDGDKPLGASATLADVFKTQFGGSLDSRHITFGGQKVNQSQTDNIQVDANNLFIMYLPYDKQLYANTGTIAPDFTFLKKLESVQAQLRQMNIDLTKPESPENINTINQLLQQNQLPLMFNPDGTLRIQDYCQFGALSGYAPEQAFEDLDDTAILARDVTDVNTVKSIERTLNKGRDNKDRISIDAKDHWYEARYDHVYQGNIFIPVINNNLNAALASGVKLTPSQAMNILDRENQKQRLQENGGYRDASNFFRQ